MVDRLLSHPRQFSAHPSGKAMDLLKIQIPVALLEFFCFFMEKLIADFLRGHVQILRSCM
jgi:hypothetical protein